MLFAQPVAKAADEGAGLIVSFGEPIVVQHSGDRKKAAHALTEMLEQRVQMLLDSIKTA